MDWDNLRFFLELARTERLTEAAQRLDVDGSTVSRRIRRLESDLGTLLFDRGNQGFALTAHGEVLLTHARRIEEVLAGASDSVVGRNAALSGQVRIGATEAFGTFVLAPHLARFCAKNPEISIDLLPVPRFVNLSKREADLAVAIERPSHGSYVVSKLTDYKLKLYGTSRYLREHPPIRALADLERHPFITYVDDLVFSEELHFMRQIVQPVRAVFRSTSAIAQYTATCRGHAIGILPCFLAQQNDDLIPILDDLVGVVRTFWLIVPTDRRNVARVRATSSWLQDMVRLNRDFLMGSTREMRYVG